VRVLLPLKASIGNRIDTRRKPTLVAQEIKEKIAESHSYKGKEKERKEEEENEHWEEADLLGLHLLDDVSEAVHRLMRGTSGWGMGWNGVLPSEERRMAPFWQDFRNLSCVAVLKLRHPYRVRYPPPQTHPVSPIEEVEGTMKFLQLVEYEKILGS